MQGRHFFVCLIANGHVGSWGASGFRALEPPILDCRPYTCRSETLQRTLTRASLFREQTSIILLLCSPQKAVPSSGARSVLELEGLPGTIVGRPMLTTGRAKQNNVNDQLTSENGSSND